MSYFTLTSTTATTVLSNSAFQSQWLDPYDPQEFYYSNSGTGGKISSYHIANDTITDHYTGGTVYKMIVRYLGDGSLYTHTSNLIVSLADISNPATIYTGTSGTIETIAVSSDGSKIFFTEQNSPDMKALNISAGTSSVIYTHTVPFGSVTLETDPADGTYLVFVDDNDEIYSLNILAGTITLLAASPIGNNCKTIKALDGTIVIAPWNQTGYGLIKINSDGTGQEVYTTSGLTKIMVLDTINKKIFTLDFSKNLREFSVPALPDLPPLPSLFGTPKSVYIDWTWDSSNTYYRLDLNDGTTTTTVLTGSSDLAFTTNNLLPETSYTGELYSSSDDITYTLSTTTVVSTLPNTAANFDTSVFYDAVEMKYDFSDLSSNTLSIVGEVFDELFTTADVFKITDSAGTLHENASFINDGSMVNLSDSEVFYLPFETSNGAAQQVSLTLSDTSTEIITYNDTNNKITVDGTEYGVGQNFYLDGKLIYVRGN